MKTTITPANRAKEGATPFHIDSATVGVSLEDSDKAMFDFLGLWSAHGMLARLELVHVVPGIYLFDRHNGYDSYDFDKYEAESVAVQQFADSLADRFPAGNGLRVSVTVREGDPLSELLALTEQSGSDLFVIGKGTSKESHHILGRNLTRKMPAHTLMVPEQSASKMERILVPFDFSPFSVKALREALRIRLAMKGQPEIIALNVYELPAFPAYLIRKSREEFRKTIHADRRLAFRDFLHTHFSAEESRLVRMELVEQNHPGVGGFLYHYALQQDVDLIVMGAKGHSRAGLLLMGSVTEKLMTLTTSIPILVVK
ncbi:MAG: hypothetical protein RLY31_3141 [Bacteroidota bacterium]|jgi:nucleotide-binding universal stress UspA family protein